MEGFDATGIRQVLGIPRGRFSIPLIVSTGVPYQGKDGGSEEKGKEKVSNVSLSHGGRGIEGASRKSSPRYPLEEVVFGNKFGRPFNAP